MMDDADQQDNDQDVHMCLACHQIIVGLLNYVRHKKLECTATSKKPPQQQQTSSEKLRRAAENYTTDTLLRNVRGPPSESYAECKPADDTFASIGVAVTAPPAEDTFASIGVASVPPLSVDVTPEISSLLSCDPLVSPNTSAPLQLNSALDIPVSIQSQHIADCLAHHNSSTTQPLDSPPTSSQINLNSVVLDHGASYEHVSGHNNSNNDIESHIQQIDDSCKSVIMNGTPSNQSDNNVIEAPKKPEHSFFLSLELQSKSHIMSPTHHKDLSISNIFDAIQFSSDDDDNDNDILNDMLDPNKGFSFFDDTCGDDDEDNVREFTGGKWRPGQRPPSQIRRRYGHPRQSQGKWRPGQMPTRVQNRWPDRKQHGYSLRKISRHVVAELRDTNKGVEFPKNKSQNKSYIKKSNCSPDEHPYALPQTPSSSNQQKKLLSANDILTSSPNQSLTAGCQSCDDRDSVTSPISRIKRNDDTVIDDGGNTLCQPSRAKRNVEPSLAKRNVEPFLAKRNDELSLAKRDDEPSRAKRNDDTVIIQSMKKASKSHADQLMSVFSNSENTHTMSGVEPIEVIDSSTHDSNQANVKTQPYCSICNRIFKNHFNIARHILTKSHSRLSLGHKDRLLMLETYHVYILSLSPYQCRVCRFYCYREDDLLAHIQSAPHVSKAQSLLGPLLCVSCKYKCKYNDEMRVHLESSEHQAHSKGDKPCVIKESRFRVHCRLCGLLVQSLAELTKHLASRHPNNEPAEIRHRNSGIQKVHCQYCSYAANSRLSLEIHVRRKHTHDRPYHCLPCDKSFCDKYTLHGHERSQRHQDRVDAGLVTRKSDQSLSCNIGLIDKETSKKKESRGRPRKSCQMKLFKCRHCDFVTDDYKALRPHYLGIHKSLVFTCVSCSQVFTNKNTLKGHQTRFGHGDWDIDNNHHSFKCPKCDKKFENENWLKYHLYTHSNILLEEKDVVEKYHCKDKTSLAYAAFLLSINETLSHIPVICPEQSCNKRIIKLRILEHLRSHTSDRIFSCPMCDKRFFASLVLKRHLQVHLGLTYRKCETCGKEFTKVLSYNNHVKIHMLDNKGYMCDVCSKIFPTQPQLTCHMRRHQEKKHICPYEGCNGRFSFNSELVQHMTMHTKLRPYLCDTCGYSARYKNQLTRHTRTHTGERNYPCDYCEYKAMNSTHLRRHMRIHIGSKPYQCPYCEYSCNTHENIRKHIVKTKKHFGLKIYPCKFCTFATNSVDEFKSHLLDKHSDMVSVDNLGTVSAFSGLYISTADPKKPAEGTLINPVKEKKLNVRAEKRSKRRKLASSPTLQTLTIVDAKMDDCITKPGQRANSFCISSISDITTSYKDHESADTRLIIQESEHTVSYSHQQSAMYKPDMEPVAALLKQHQQTLNVAPVTAIKHHPHTSNKALIAALKLQQHPTDHLTSSVELAQQTAYPPSPEHNPLISSSSSHLSSSSCSHGSYQAVLPHQLYEVNFEPGIHHTVDDNSLSATMASDALAFVPLNMISAHNAPISFHMSHCVSEIGYHDDQNVVYEDL